MPENSVLKISLNLGLKQKKGFDNLKIFGFHDKNISLFEEYLSIKIQLLDNQIKLIGDEQNLFIAEKLLKFLAVNETIVEDNELKYYIRQLKKDSSFDLKNLINHSLKVSKKGKIIRARGKGQAEYLDAMNKKNLIFGIGPAGTGKTYLAMAHAISKLITDEVNRIVLVRPVVEAGENLGFLPGDLTQKINPYLRPLYDAMYDMIGFEEYNEYYECKRIEVVPLAYMRGRTLNNSIVILDEAQNTTISQMKMFLTRLGIGSKAIVTGDITQVDLPTSKMSGLVNAVKVLDNISDAEFVWFTKNDIVRHKLVQDIIDAYEKYEKKKNTE